MKQEMVSNIGIDSIIQPGPSAVQFCIPNCFKDHTSISCVEVRTSLIFDEHGYAMFRMLFRKIHPYVCPSVCHGRPLCQNGVNYSRHQYLVGMLVSSSFRKSKSVFYLFVFATRQAGHGRKLWLRA